MPIICLSLLWPDVCKSTFQSLTSTYQEINLVRSNLQRLTNLGLCRWISIGLRRLTGNQRCHTISGPISLYSTGMRSLFAWSGAAFTTSSWHTLCTLALDQGIMIWFIKRDDVWWDFNIAKEWCYILSLTLVTTKIASSTSVMGTSKSFRYGTWW